MTKRQRRHPGPVFIADGVDRLRPIALIPLPCAGAVQEPVADETVAGFEVLHVDRRQCAVFVSPHAASSIAEGGERHAQEGEVAGPAMARPHAFPVALAADQHVEPAIALQERHLVDRASAAAKAGRRAAIERHPHYERRIGPLAVVFPGRGPDIYRIRRDIEHPAARAQHPGGGALHLGRGQVAATHRMQGWPVVRIEGSGTAIDAVARQDPLELRPRGSALPATQCGHVARRIESSVQADINRRVEDQRVADQSAGVVPCGVIVAAAQLVGRPIAKAAIATELEYADLGPAAFVAVADHHHLAVRHEHFVVPGALRVDVRAVGIGGGGRCEPVVADADSEQPASAQHDQEIAAALDDVAFIDALGLVVGDRSRIGDGRASDRDCVQAGGISADGAGRLQRHRRGRRCRGRWHHAGLGGESGGFPLSPCLRLPQQFFQVRMERGIVLERGQARGRCWCREGGSRGERGERDRHRGDMQGITHGFPPSGCVLFRGFHCMYP